MGMQVTKNWTREAACREAPKEVFYPIRKVSGKKAAMAAWRDFCSLCPVWDECFKASADEEWGIWAGLTYEQRLLYQGDAKAAKAAAMTTYLKEAA